MNFKIVSVILVLQVLAYSTALFAQTLCLNEYEKLVYEKIMQARTKKNLGPIPLSAALTRVAQTHAKDLAENHPDHNRCNMHSWSNKGHWTPCCYSPEDRSSWPLMWQKPEEISGYKSRGYEIAFYYSCTADPDDYVAMAMKMWSKSQGHSSVYLNQNNWKNNQWKAIGVGVYKGYALVWFGELSDTLAAPVYCK